ncbi:hypothetical protein D3C79_936630 [compost metagenome]
MQHHLVDVQAPFFDGHAAVGDAAAIDIHVIFLGFPQARVGRQLDRRGGRAAVGRAAAGGEGDQVGPASDLAGGRDRVVAGRVHEHQAMGAHRFCVFVDIHQVTGASLGHRPQ